MVWCFDQFLIEVVVSVLWAGGKVAIVGGVCGAAGGLRPEWIGAAL